MALEPDDLSESDARLDDDPGAFLRSRGLRVTPQRRAILGAFRGRSSEHLSADEIHSRAAAVVPELGRGTVYATLAELTELGILVARGSPEPVRYETNTAAHQHFRCRLCTRTFDVDIEDPNTKPLAAGGFTVEQVAVIAEGICAECRNYDLGLSAAAEYARGRPSTLPQGTAASTISTPVGTVSLGSTSAGMVRVVFDNHADVPALHDAMRTRRGSRAAKAHIATAHAAVDDYFARRAPRDCPIDWDQIDGIDSLRAVLAVPRGAIASYDTLDTPDSASELGRVLGSNPLSILIPCHRIARGQEIPSDYVGGNAIRRELCRLEHE